MTQDPRDSPASEPKRSGDPRRPEGGPWPRPSHAPPYANGHDQGSWTSSMSSAIEVLAILRRRWLRVAVTCVIVVVATLLGISMVEREYRAEVSLLLNPS